jgi:hypothetical protein
MTIFWKIIEIKNVQISEWQKRWNLNSDRFKVENFNKVMKAVFYTIS